MKLDIQFVKFILVGIINTMFGYGVFALLLFIGLHYSLCTILTTIVGILFNFKTTGVLVFNNHDNKLILKYVCMYGIMCLFGIVFLRFAKILGVNLYIAGLVLTCIMPLISFVLQKRWVFKS